MGAWYQSMQSLFRKMPWTYLEYGIDVDLIRVREAQEGSIDISACFQVADATLHRRMLENGSAKKLHDAVKRRYTYHGQNLKSRNYIFLGATLLV